MLRAQALQGKAVRPASSRSVVPFMPVCQARSGPVARRQQQLARSGSALAPQPARRQSQVCFSVPTTDKMISRTEVPAFIQRDDLIDQMLSWSKVEAAEAGQRNFGLPMTVTPQFIKTVEGDVLWGFYVGIFREGKKLCDISCSFDREVVKKFEYLGIGEDGMPMNEGRATEVQGKNFEIWKVGEGPVDEDLRATIRGYCTALAQALNRYYAFGSVFVDDSQ